MPKINPDKGYAQMPLRHPVTDMAKIPADWLTRLGKLVVDDLLHLDDQQILYPYDEDSVIGKLTKKTEFLHHLDRHAGDDSKYSLKQQLHESLKVIYATLIDPATPKDQQQALAIKLVEGAENCTPGFHNRTNECVISLSVPESLDDLLSIYRQAIVSRAANQITDEIHAYNRFFVIAQGMGYGVRPLNPNDKYQGNIQDTVIKEKITEAFTRHYTLFNMLNSLQEQLTGYVRQKGYHGRCEEGYHSAFHSKFDQILRSVIKINFFELFGCDPDKDDPKIVDINWLAVKKTLLATIRENLYFTLTPAEEALLNALTTDATAFTTFTADSWSLISSTDELEHCLSYFTEWPAEKKASLLLCYLKNKSQDDQKAVLEKLEKAPDLIKSFQSVPAIQKLYLALAAAKGDLDKVKKLVAQGADVNPVIGLLIGKQKSDMLMWMYSDPAVRATLNQDSMNAIVTEGPHKGKTVVESWVSSRKGRQLLLEDERLQNLCPPVLAGKSIAEWMKQAQDEKNVLKEGLFTPVKPEVLKFLQHVIYGEQAEAEKMLQANPSLLLEKAKVKDYSGRKIYGSALQLALGAEDVRYHDDEECMAEMIQRYLSKLPKGEEIMAEQIAAQFPEGYEEQEKAREANDLQALEKVIDAIAKSQNDADCEGALQAFRDYLQPHGTIKTGKHFNAQLLVKAFDLYDRNYYRFDGDDSRKNNLCWRKVIGYIQRFLPACYAQAFCQGIYFIVEGKEKLARSAKFRDDKNVAFYPLDSDPRFRLGVDYAWVGWRGWSSGACAMGAASTGFVYKLCQTKNVNVARFTQRAANHTQTKDRGCNVM